MFCLFFVFFFAYNLALNEKNSSEAVVQVMFFSTCILLCYITTTYCEVHITFALCIYT